MKETEEQLLLFMRMANVMNMSRMDEYTTANGKTTFYDINSCTIMLMLTLLINI